MCVFLPVESLHLVGTAQHVAPFLSQLLQGPPAIIQLLHIKQPALKQHSTQEIQSALLQHVSSRVGFKMCKYLLNN